VLGYDVDPAGGRLIVNEKESRRVREMFALFVQHHSLLPVVAELVRRRWKTKSRTSQSGKAHAGRSFTRASLRLLLTNAVYSGQVEHRGVMYPGEHASIIEPAVWQEVNAELRSGRHTGTGAICAPQNALLAGLLLCKSCQRPMIPTYTAKLGRRYRYYVCKTARQKGWSACPTKSVPARMIEGAVLDQLRTALRDSETIAPAACLICPFTPPPDSRVPRTAARPGPPRSMEFWADLRATPLCKAPTPNRPSRTATKAMLYPAPSSTWTPITTTTSM
jgi:site-specific DNA recombinase